jgi:hypothetical protein
MSGEADVREFLTSRRARLTPEAASFELLDFPADPGLTLATYSAEPGTESEARLRELACWAAARDELASRQASIEHSREAAEAP